MERAGEVRALNFVDVAAERGDERLYAEAKGRTAAPGLVTDTAYGQLLRRMPPEEVGEARFGIIAPTEAKVAALTVSARVRGALLIDVFVVDEDGEVQQVEDGGAGGPIEKEPDAQSPDRPGASTSELLASYRDILAELKRRGVIRTGNAPTGDYAETLVKVAFTAELAPNSEKSWDVVTPDGEKLQVKSRLLDDPTKSKQRQLSPIRSWGFDSLVIVLFDGSFQVWRAVKIPAQVVEGTGRRSDWVNGQLIIARDSLLDHPQAEDVTGLLREAAQGM